jgi:hypothetical protein
VDFRLCYSGVGMALSADWVRPSRSDMTLDGTESDVKFLRCARASVEVPRCVSAVRVRMSTPYPHTRFIDIWRGMPNGALFQPTEQTPVVVPYSDD